MIEFILYFGAGLACFNVGRLCAFFGKLYYRSTQDESLQNILFPDLGEQCYIDEDGNAQLCEIEYKQIKVESRDKLAIATETADGYWLVEYSKKDKYKAQDIEFEVL